MTNSNSIASDELRALIERVERIEVEQKELAADKKDVYSEALLNIYKIALGLNDG